MQYVTIVLAVQVYVAVVNRQLLYAVETKDRFHFTVKPVHNGILKYQVIIISVYRWSLCRGTLVSLRLPKEQSTVCDLCKPVVLIQRCLSVTVCVRYQGISYLTRKPLAIGCSDRHPVEVANEPACSGHFTKVIFSCK